MRRSILGVMLAGLPSALFLMGSPATAGSLYGDTVTCAITGSGSFTCNQASAIAGPGPEFQFGNGLASEFFSVDFGTSDVLLTVLANNSLGGTIFNSTDTTNAFTTAYLISASGFTGFSSSNISLSGGLLQVNLIGTSSTTGSTIDIGLATPEPATAGLVGIGSMLLMFCLRPRKKA
jgi:hypothetical protein